MSFSKRIGITPSTKAIQSESMDMDLRNSLWNAITAFYWSLYNPPYNSGMGRGDYVKGSNLHQLALAIYMFHYKKPIDTIETYWEYFLSDIRKTFYKLQWYEVYDFVEFIAQHGPETNKKNFLAACNQIYERESSAYRFVAEQITPITSPQEINEIEQAILGSDRYNGVKTHLQTALGLLTDRQNPDYRNSIKESISAVESLAKHLVGNPSATLDGALKVLEKSHKLHPALKKAFSSLYGYTNDSDGIRHALMENSELTQADARFMLICCSAFINFAIDSMKG
ncbi:hypothetical protein A7D21_17730 [Pseudomonas sp. AP19]|uniref:AbiJ-NTD4 domain-containing protein n=1 Tax=Pseudomonas TaxID=286 RepID=UPI00084A5594|nr:hypothetical protein [Pseudomonas sp. AP19]OEC72677.1 hypothetical protein A7D21_17730 [Pseudomonas sp. AP19]